MTFHKCSIPPRAPDPRGPQATDIIVSSRLRLVTLGSATHKRDTGEAKSDGY
jgi:hypothetical protein